MKREIKNGILEITIRGDDYNSIGSHSLIGQLVEGGILFVGDTINLIFECSYPWKYVQTPDFVPKLLILDMLELIALGYKLNLIEKVLDN